MNNPVKYHYGKFPPTKIDWQKLISLIGPANAALARYDATLEAIPNATVFLSPLTTQEAVLSSRIEGTQATMGEVLEYEVQGDESKLPKNKKGDIQEILNYRKAILESVDSLKKLPLCQRVIKTAHKTLMADVRGQNKDPGQYRQGQNHIGKPGCPIEQARFIPASPEKLQEGMSKWEKYIHSPADEKLIQLAVLHAEFESLHPFWDGNGRIGRLFIPLFLYNSELIKTPMFYISEYFEANCKEYYEKLLAVSRDNNWTDWCAFFLKAISIQAKENQERASKILKLYDEKKHQIQDVTKSQYSVFALDFIFEHPLFKSTDFAKTKNIPTPSAKAIISKLYKSGITKLLQKQSGSRPAFYTFPELLNIAEGNKVF